MKAILWDYAGVLAAETEFAVADLAASCGLPREVWTALVAHLVDTDRWWDRVERGEIGLDAFATEMRDRVRHAGGECDLDAGRYLWWGGRAPREARPLNTATVELASALSDEYVTGIATNNVREFRDSWTADLPAELIGNVFDSSEIGARKPEPAFWISVEARLGLAPHDIVLVDDNSTMVAAAAMRGWQTVHYTFAEQCGDALRELAGRRRAAGGPW